MWSSLFLLSIIVAFLAFFYQNYYKNQSKNYLNPNSSSQLKVFQSSELKDDSRILLSIVGRVFDVSSGHKFYGDDGGYSMLAKKDASRAFGTGIFSPEELIDDLKDLLPGQCVGVNSYLEFYLSHNEYKFVGLLEGRFFNQNGDSTKELDIFEECLAEGKKVDDIAKTHEPTTCQVINKENKGNESTETTNSSAYYCPNTNGIKRLPRIVEYATVDGLEQKCLCFDQEVALARLDLKTVAGCNKESNLCPIE